MKTLSLTPTLLVLGITAVILLSVHNRFDGFVQIKIGSDGGEVIIDGRQTKGEALPPSLNR